MKSFVRYRENGESSLGDVAVGSLFKVKKTTRELRIVNAA